jgi:hypothetical protein
VSRTIFGVWELYFMVTYDRIKLSFPNAEA